MSDQWCVGPLVCRTIGVSDQWCVGPLVCRTIGVSDQWCVGPLVCRTNGVSDQWLVTSHIHSITIPIYIDLGPTRRAHNKYCKTVPELKFF